MGHHKKNALLSILTKLRQWNDLIISQLQAIFQPFSPAREIFVKLANYHARYRNGRRRRQNVYLLKIVAREWKSEHL